MRKALLIILIIIGFSLQGCASFFEGEPEFVKVKDTQFLIGGKPYYFVGTNYWYGFYLGSPGQTGDRERLIRELDQLKETGITNLRVLGASEEFYLKAAVDPPIQSKPGIYNEALLKGLDFFLAEMGKRDMKAVVYLNNYWEWSGGFAVYNRWTDSSKSIDPNNPKQGWGAYMDYSASFYRNEKANKIFRDYIYMLLTRINTITGQRYLDDPTIMSWQLANEPRPGANEASLEYIEYFHKWIDETAGYIHSIDMNHLVSSGNEGLAGCIQNEDVYLTSHKSKNIDYMTMHLWAKNWGWYKADNAAATYPVAEENALDYINKHIVYARQLNKPITMEEFGIGRDLESCDPNSSTFYRDKYFSKIFEVVYDSAKAGAPIAGTNFWGWGGEAVSPNSDNIWRVGDPFMGDPPQEPQGLNSVLSTDQSTLKIIKEYSDKMKSISK